MANFAYTYGKVAFFTGTDLSSDDIRVMMVMSNTTADTDVDAQFIASFGTLDEFDGTNNARKTLANKAVAADEPNNRAEFTSDPVTWTALGAGTRQGVGLVFYKFVTNDADSVPLFFYDDDFPITPGGGDVTATANAEGWGQIT